MQLCYVFNTKSSVLSALEFSASDKKRAVSVLERLKINWMTVIIPWVPETFLARFPVSVKSL